MKNIDWDEIGIFALVAVVWILGAAVLIGLGWLVIWCLGELGQWIIQVIREIKA